MLLFYSLIIINNNKELLDLKVKYVKNNFLNMRNIIKNWWSICQVQYLNDPYYKLIILYISFYINRRNLLICNYF